MRTVKRTNVLYDTALTHGEYSPPRNVVSINCGFVCHDVDLEKIPFYKENRKTQEK
jgi:hypothetical protein